MTSSWVLLCLAGAIAVGLGIGLALVMMIDRWDERKRREKYGMGPVE